MKLRHTIMAVGLFISACLALFGDKNSSEQIAAPVVREASTKPLQNKERLSSNKNKKQEPTIFVLLPREEVKHETTFANDDSTLFSNQNWLPPAPPPPKPVPPPPPTAPSMPFTYLGKKMEDGVWEVYLARGNDIIIVGSQSQIDASYRVESIVPPILTMTYLPLNQTQKITIGEAG
jgi:hypothetical protein